MYEIDGLCTRDRSSCVAPADFADAREDVGDRLLFSVMMYSGPESRSHLEQTAPDGRCNTERRCDSDATLRARSLRRFLVEFSRADDVDCGRAHGIPGQVGLSIGKLS